MVTKRAKLWSSVRVSWEVTIHYINVDFSTPNHYTLYDKKNRDETFYASIVNQQFILIVGNLKKQYSSLIKNLSQNKFKT